MNGYPLACTEYSQGGVWQQVRGGTIPERRAPQLIRVKVIFTVKNVLSTAKGRRLLMRLWSSGCNCSVLGRVIWLVPVLERHMA